MPRNNGLPSGQENYPNHTKGFDHYKYGLGHDGRNIARDIRADLDDRAWHSQPQIFGPYSDPAQLEHYEFFNPPPCDFVAALSSSLPATPVESPPQFYIIDPSSATMSLAYENRGFAEYPQSTIMDDPTAHDHDHDHNHNHDHSHDHMHHEQIYTSPPVTMSNNDPMSNDDPYAQIESALELQMQDLPQHKEDDEDAGSPRATALAKPIREIVKDSDGKFVCTWVCFPSLLGRNLLT